LPQQLKHNVEILNIMEINDFISLSLQNKASKRKNVLDEAYGQQGFLADSRDLVSFFLIFKVHRNRTYRSLS